MVGDGTAVGVAVGVGVGVGPGVGVGVGLAPCIGFDNAPIRIVPARMIPQAMGGNLLAFIYLSSATGYEPRW